MKIMITGSEGLIGKGLSEYYLKDNNEVITIDKKLGYDLATAYPIINTFCLNTDVLINCFGLNHNITEATIRDDHSIDSFDEYMNINVSILYKICQLYAKNNSKGCVINFGSLYSYLIPDPEMSQKHPGYVASKFAVIGLTKYMAKYFPHIRFNCLCPGGVLADQTKEFLDKYKKKLMIKRMCQIEDIAKACDFLINCDYITGQSIIIDGGYSL